MKSIDTLLLTLDGSDEAIKGLGAALWLAERLPATLYLLNATDQPLPVDEALERLRVPEASRARVVLHQATQPPDQALLEAVRAHAAQLVIMSARGASAPNHRRTGRVAESILQLCPVPVLLLPRQYQQSLPWRRMLVAASGEAAADQALAAAMQLAVPLGLEITVAHCVGQAQPAAPEALGRYADAPHHELPRRLNEIVGRAGARPQECRCVREVLLCRGEPAAELLALLAKGDTDLLVLGWHGGFGAGRAQVLKEVLDEARCPVLIVREAARPKARLKLAGDAGQV